MNLSDFSVVSTNVEVDSQSQLIKKTYSLNVTLGITTFEVKGLMDNYLSSLRSSNIAIPEVTNSYVQDEKIVYECHFCGQNIVELGLTVSNFEEFEPFIREMSCMVNKAILGDVYFDPHPKNFVFNTRGDIFYVDFFPPYSDYLKSKRLEVALDSEKQIITENYAFFTRDFLAAHFCGDFLNIDPMFESSFHKIYAIVHDLGMFGGSLSDFVTLAKKIRHTEDTRIARNIYLL